jgi:chromosome segregation ATPase
MEHFKNQKDKDALNRLAVLQGEIRERRRSIEGLRLAIKRVKPSKATQTLMGFKSSIKEKVKDAERIEDEITTLQQETNLLGKEFDDAREDVRGILQSGMRSDPMYIQQIQIKNGIAKLITNVDELEPFARNLLDSIGRAKNTMSYNYNRDKQAYAPGCSELFQKVTDAAKIYDTAIEIATSQIKSLRGQRKPPFDEVVLPEMKVRPVSKRVANGQSRPIAENSALFNEVKAELEQFIESHHTSLHNAAADSSDMTETSWNQWLDAIWKREIKWNEEKVEPSAEANGIGR